MGVGWLEFLFEFGVARDRNLTLRRREDRAGEAVVVGGGLGRNGSAVDRVGSGFACQMVEGY